MKKSPSQLLAPIRRYLSGLRARTDPPELEQGLIRVVAAILVVAFFGTYVFRSLGSNLRDEQVLVATIIYLTASALLLVSILFGRQVSRVRRSLGILIDNVGITYFMAMMGEEGAVMFGLYLFVVFGNGFRYGRQYLHASQAMALLGFSSVLLLDAHWASTKNVGLACFFALLVLPFYVSVLAQRITDAKRRADAANQAKGRFLANVSHEMRTPLNGVIAMSDILRETNLDGAQREIVNTMATSAHLLLAQIEDVLDMAKIEAGRVQIETRAFDLEKMVNVTVNVLMPQARLKGLSLLTSVESTTHGRYLGDQHHIRQVLLNLLANAVKFTERGEIWLRVFEIGRDTNSSTLRFDVGDTGIGIPPDKLDSIFEPFTQADDSVTRIYGGTGLGTTIARQLIVLMKGEIGVNSVLGVGSHFWFQLTLERTTLVPIEDDVEITLRKPMLLSSLSALKAKSGAPPFRRARVLVAEDNPTNQRVTELILESGGHHVTIVDNGEDALDALDKGGFDLAIFDVSMPIVSGLEALKLYQFTTQSPIPVLMLSANVTTDIIAECKRAGASEFLPKPIRAGVLLDSIDRHIALREKPVDQGHGTQGGADNRPLLALVTPPPIDIGVLDELAKIGTDPTFIHRLVLGFCGDADRLLTRIKSSLNDSCYDDVKDAAHALKGGAASVGAGALVNIAIRLEKATHDQLRARTANFIEELTSRTKEAAETLEDYLMRHRPFSVKTPSE